MDIVLPLRLLGSCLFIHLPAIGVRQHLPTVVVVVVVKNVQILRIGSAFMTEGNSQRIQIARDLVSPRFRSPHRGEVAGNDSVVKAVVGEAWVAVYSGVSEGSVFVAAEREDGLVHVLGVEHLETHEQVKVLDG